MSNLKPDIPGYTPPKRQLKGFWGLPFHSTMDEALRSMEYRKVHFMNYNAEKGILFFQGGLFAGNYIKALLLNFQNDRFIKADLIFGEECKKGSDDYHMNLVIHENIDIMIRAKHGGPNLIVQKGLLRSFECADDNHIQLSLTETNQVLLSYLHLTETDKSGYDSYLFDPEALKDI